MFCKSVKQKQFAGWTNGFLWTEDIKVDILSHHLNGMAERYYTQRVEG